MLGQRRADGFTITWKQVKYALRNTCFKEQLHGLKRGERGLLCRFCDNGITRRKRCCDLTSENRQREVPWRDADKRAAAVKAEMVGLACWARQAGRLVEVGFGLVCVIATKIDGFANFGHAVGQRFAAFARHKRDEEVHILFELVAHFAQNVSASDTAFFIPCRLGFLRRFKGFVDILWSGPFHLADNARKVMRAKHVMFAICAGFAVHDRAAFARHGLIQLCDSVGNRVTR